MRLKQITLLASFLFISACAEETFTSTCIGFAKSHWKSFINEDTTYKSLCSCVNKEISGVSETGTEAIRAAMSNSIVMRNRFDSELNKAIKDNTLTKKERETYEFALGQCLKGSSVEEEKVDSMIDQFKALR